MALTSFLLLLEVEPKTKFQAQCQPCLFFPESFRLLLSASEVILKSIKQWLLFRILQEMHTSSFFQPINKVKTGENFSCSRKQASLLATSFFACTFQMCSTLLFQVILSSFIEVSAWFLTFFNNKLCRVKPIFWEQ